MDNGCNEYRKSLGRVLNIKHSDLFIRFIFHISSCNTKLTYCLHIPGYPSQAMPDPWPWTRRGSFLRYFRHLKLEQNLEGRNYLCSFCNLQDNKTVFHIVIRESKKLFWENYWSTGLIRNIMGGIGRPWRGFGEYSIAWIIKRELIREFNL